jgi:hypothetical protein
MKNNLLLLLWLLLSPFGLFAQEFSQNYWHEGEVDTEIGETVSGKLKYHIEDNTLQFQNGTTLKSYSPRTVKAFQLKDALTKKERVFYTLDYKDENGSENKYFFELLVEGHFSLFCREKIMERIENYHDPYWIGGRNVRVSYLAYDFFLMNEKGVIKRCESNIKSLQAFMKGQESDIKEFVKRNKLSLSSREDMIKIIEYYNENKK